ncbi:hypothetical protein ACFL3Q_05025 [Planctomycetota bacterium]
MPHFLPGLYCHRISKNTLELTLDMHKSHDSAVKPDPEYDSQDEKSPYRTGLIYPQVFDSHSIIIVEINGMIRNL